MPTIQEPNIDDDESIDGDIEPIGGQDGIGTSAHGDATGGRKAGTFSGGRGGGRGGASAGESGDRRTRRTDPSGPFAKHSLMTKVREV